VLHSCMRSANESLLALAHIQHDVAIASTCETETLAGGRDSPRNEKGGITVDCVGLALVPPAR